MDYKLKIKKPFIIVAIITLLICFIPNFQTEESEITIICTNSILADFTKNLLKENVEIDYIMPAGACPVHFDTTPSDVSKITSASIIISLGWEPWLIGLLENSGNLNYSEIKCQNLGEWNIPSGAKKYVEVIKNGLSEILSDKRETIQTNAQEYFEEIDFTSKNLQEMISNNDFIGRKIICMEWHKDFLEWLGLNVSYYYAPPERLSTLDIINVTNAANNDDICVIIDNLQSGTDFGAHISSESGLIHLVFTNFPGAIPNTDSYLDMITYNTQKLVDGISTYDYKQGEISELESNISLLEIERNVSLLGLVIIGLIAVIFIILYKKK